MTYANIRLKSFKVNTRLIKENFSLSNLFVFWFADSIHQIFLTFLFVSLVQSVIIKTKYCNPSSSLPVDGSIVF